MSNISLPTLEPTEQLLPILTGRLSRPSTKILWIFAIAAATFLIVGLLVWQAITAAGNPDPTKDASRVSAIVDTAILVFREGLEAILVLAALTASLVRTQEGYWKPVATGAGLSFLATVATWFIAVAIIASFNASALHVQAATGLLAILVLLVIMNWFFHKVYWTGWITHHNRRRQNLVQSTNRTGAAIFRGLMLVGFTSVYREGFEVVLFLQSIRLQVGSQVVLAGAAIGVGLTLIVALLTFVAHYKLPYKRMLVLTGIMLGGVLLVMVGEEIQEMQQANWLPTHAFNINIPDWMGTWFSVFNNWETIIAQVFAGTFVVGSYYLARRVCQRKPAASECIVPDCNNCSIHNTK